MDSISALKVVNSNELNLVIGERTNFTTEIALLDTNGNNLITVDRSRFSPKWETFGQVKQWPRNYDTPAFEDFEELLNNGVLKTNKYKRQYNKVIDILFTDLFRCFK
jgi:hypothetical protein